MTAAVRLLFQTPSGFVVSRCWLLAACFVFDIEGPKVVEGAPYHGGRLGYEVPARMPSIALRLLQRRQKWVSMSVSSNRSRALRWQYKNVQCSCA